MSLIFNPINTSGKVSTVGDVHEAVETAPNTIEIENDIVTLQAEIASLLASGGLSYKGTWNASTNTPTLASGVGSKGDYYVVSADGSTNIDGITDWVIADWIIFNGTVWEKADHTDAVTSVSGKQGAVTLDNADVGLDQVVNLKHNYNAISDPTANDDTTQGYQVGSRWKDTTNHHEFVCTDATATLAIWTRTTAKDTSHIAENPANLYYTEARVSANTDVTSNTSKVSADGSIATHSDVTMAGPSAGNILYRDGGGQWTNLTTGADTQTLQLSGGFPSWQSVGLNNLSDVTLTTPSTGGVLYKSAGDWLDSEEVLITPGTGVICANALDSQGGKIGSRSWVMKNPTADGMVFVDNFDPITGLYVEGTVGVPESAGYIRMQGADLFIEAYDAGEAGDSVTGQTTVFETSKLVASIGTTNGLEISSNLSVSDALSGGVLCLSCDTSPSSINTTGSNLTSFFQLGDNIQLSSEEAIGGNRFMNMGSSIYKDSADWKAGEASIGTSLFQIGNNKLEWLVDTSTGHIIGDTVTLVSKMDVDTTGNLTIAGDLTTSGTTLTAKLAGKSNTGHTHTSTDITDFPTAVANQVTTKADKANETHTGTTTINQIDCDDITATGLNPNLILGPNGSGANTLTLKTGATTGAVLSSTALQVAHTISQYTSNTPLTLTGNGTKDYVKQTSDGLWCSDANAVVSIGDSTEGEPGNRAVVPSLFLDGLHTVCSYSGGLLLASNIWVNSSNTGKNSTTTNGCYVIYSKDYDPTSGASTEAFVKWYYVSPQTVTKDATVVGTIKMDLRAGGNCVLYSGSFTPFTGSHDVSGNITDTTNGLVICTTGISHYKDKLNSIPEVVLCDHDNCKKVYGVTDWSENKDTLSSVSLGEANMWVTDYNGLIENGDLITTSAIEGYGKLQDSDIFMNYTVAKCTQDIDWDNITDTIVYNSISYKKAYVACTFHCG